MGVLDTIKQASRAKRSVEIVLDSALEDEWLSLKGRLVDAADEDVKTGSLARPATTEIVDQMEAIRDTVEASRVTFVFESLPWEERVGLQVKHQPRKDNRLDTITGYNIETFTPAIIRRACIGALGPGETEATPLTDEVWDDLLGKLSYGQIDRLYTAAYAVNDGVTRVPTSARSLLGIQDSGASLAQPGPGPARPRNASKAGSRRGSRSTSTAKKAAPTPEGSSAA